MQFNAEFPRQVMNFPIECELYDDQFLIFFSNFDAVLHIVWDVSDSIDKLNELNSCEIRWLNIREFKKPRRRRQGQRRLKNEFIFYLRISRYSKVI